MQKENVNTSHTDVMPALAKFAQEAYLQGDVQEMPEEMQEIFDRLMETEHGDQLHIRLKMMRCRDFIKMFAASVEPFSFDQVMIVTDRYCNE